MFNLSTMEHEKMRRKLQRKLQIYEQCDSEKMHGFEVFDIVFNMFFRFTEAELL